MLIDSNVPVFNVPVFQNSQKNAAFIKHAAQLFKARACSIPKALWKEKPLTLRDIEKTDLIKREAIYKGQSIFDAALAKLNDPKISDVVTQAILKKYIQTHLLNGKHRKDYTRADQAIAILFANQVINQSNLSDKDKALLMLHIKNEYPDHDITKPLISNFTHLNVIEGISFIDRVLDYYSLTPELKVELLTALCNKVPLEVALTILASLVPLEYFIATVPADELEKTLNQTDFNIDFEAEYKAIEEMRDNALDANYMHKLLKSRFTPTEIQSKRHHYFDLQYGIKSSGFIAFYNEFSMTPLQVQADKTIVKGFINPHFIKSFLIIDEEKTKNNKKLNLCFRLGTLYRLPRTIGTLPHLEELNLAQNHLRYLPLEFTKLQSLKILRFHKNLSSSISEYGESEDEEPRQISVDVFLPPEICELIALEELHLSGNSLSYLPDKFANLQNLKQLYCDRNQFEIFPPQIYSLPQLKTLDVVKNPKLKSLPFELENLTSLRYMFVPKEMPQEEVSKINFPKNCTVSKSIY